MIIDIICVIAVMVSGASIKVQFGWKAFFLAMIIEIASMVFMRQK